MRPICGTITCRCPKCEKARADHPLDDRLEVVVPQGQRFASAPVQQPAINDQFKQMLAELADEGWEIQIRKSS